MLLVVHRGRVVGLIESSMRPGTSVRAGTGEERRRMAANRVKQVSGSSILVHCYGAVNAKAVIDEGSMSTRIQSHGD